mmetsp:Transcript_33795/g.81934  ORF Transcript_33795/g.81934 Transcript_33795/m.81934 type:complete len:226 (-) Transcript_33795:2390-3067(-)
MISWISTRTLMIPCSLDSLLLLVLLPMKIHNNNSSNSLQDHQQRHRPVRIDVGDLLHNLLLLIFQHIQRQHHSLITTIQRQRLLTAAIIITTILILLLLIHHHHIIIPEEEKVDPTAALAVTTDVLLHLPVLLPLLGLLVEDPRDTHRPRITQVLRPRAAAIQQERDTILDTHRHRRHHRPTTIIIQNNGKDTMHNHHLVHFQKKMEFQFHHRLPRRLDAIMIWM